MAERGCCCPQFKSQLIPAAFGKMIITTLCDASNPFVFECQHLLFFFGLELYWLTVVFSCIVDASPLLFLLLFISANWPVQSSV